MSNPVIIVVGVGPGLGSAIASRFGRAGYDVALIARNEARLTAIGSELQAAGVTAGWSAVDMTDEDAFRAAVMRFGGHAGRVDVLHFNPSAYTAKSALDLSPAELLADLNLGVASLLSAVQAARPFMSAGGRITATGSRAAQHPSVAAASLGVQKAGLRNLVSGLDKALSPDGVRAATLTVDGTIAADTPFDPKLIADALFDLVQVPNDTWHDDVIFDGG